MARTQCLIALALLGLVATTHAYPHLWAQEFSEGNCNAVPTKGFSCHKSPQPDSATTISVTDGNGKVVAKVCAGKSYTVNVQFPEARLSYLTLNGGAVARANSLNQKCRNTFTFSKPNGFSPSSSVYTTATVPASASTWEVSVASAKGGCAPFMIAKASVPVVSKC